MEFHATFQTRTPLRILRRHGQMLPLGATLPDDFELWMGIWFPKPKTFRDIGLDIDEPHFESMVASHAGPVTASEYLPFLIAVREAVEDIAGGTEGRIDRLQSVCGVLRFARYVTAEGGATKLCDRFFPPILSLIPVLPASAQTALLQCGVGTVNDLRRASDRDLLEIKGIGAAKLRAIRGFCTQYDGDPEAERAVNLVF